MINFLNFYPEDHITISEKSPYLIAKKLGSLRSADIKKILKEKLTIMPDTYYIQESEFLLHRMFELSKKNTFTIKSINYLSRYISSLKGFCVGAGITLVEGAFLQSFADSGCQTILMQDNATQAINVIHTEENHDDNDLKQLNMFLDGLRSNKPHHELFEKYKDTISSLYHYRLVHVDTPNSSYMYFAYPGLCSAGPSFAINTTKQLLIAADTLTAVENTKPKHIWANAVVSMLFDCGRIDLMDTLLTRMQKKHLQVLGGYAVHAVSYGKHCAMQSWEFIGDTVQKQPAFNVQNRTGIAQTNRALHPSLKTIDAHQSPITIGDMQQFILFNRRIDQLCSIAKERIHPTRNNTDDIKNLLSIIALPISDIETTDHGQIFAGFPTIAEAGYLVGAFNRRSSEIMIGKLTPPPNPKRTYFLTYDKHNPAHTRNKQRNLKTMAKKQYQELPKALRVAVVYSLPTKRSLSTTYGSSDEDTSYVANKVMAAISNKRFAGSLHPIGEHSIDSIRLIQADCIVNLIEWTGLDAGLKHKAFESLRKLAIPVTGATEVNLFETENKLTMKKAFMRFSIPTPKWQAFITGKEEIYKNFHYPAIVKPANEHCSVGISEQAIARSFDSAVRIIKKQMATFQQPALMEEFIDGRELLVYLLEDASRIRVLPIEEVIFEKNRTFAFQTYESKWDKTHRDYKTTHVQLAHLSERVQRKLESTSKRAFTKLGFRGYARFDVRLKNEKIYILETNANPNIYDSDDEQIPGIEFSDFVETIIKTAIFQYKKGWKI